MTSTTLKSPLTSTTSLRRPRRAGAAALGLVVLLGAGGLAAVGTLPRLRLERALADEAAVASAEALAPHVTVVRPKHAPATTHVLLPGSAEPAQEATIFARTSGYLARTLVDIGDRVEAGQLLAEIESPEVDQDLAEARARLAEARANLELARATLARYQAVTQAKVISRQELDDQAARTNSAVAAVEVATATVSRLTTEQGWQRVTAPFAGVITARTVDKGALITAGSGTTVTSLFRLASTDTLRVFTNAPQAVWAALAPGQAAEVLVAELPGAVFSGTIARTAGVLDPTTRTLRTEVSLPNQDGQLTAGLFVQVRFAVSRQAPTLLVPGPALVTRADGPHLLVVDAEGIVRARAVRLGRDLGAELEVLEGLSAEERVIGRPNDSHVEGSRVTPVDRTP